MFSAASAPMWVALIALVGTIVVPIIQGRIAKNSPQSKADAAEKFTKIAAGVADDYGEMRQELRELKPLLRELIRLLDQLVPKCAATDESIRLKQVIDTLRDHTY
jgi:hypothetical protein